MSKGGISSWHYRPPLRVIVLLVAVAIPLAHGLGSKANPVPAKRARSVASETELASSPLDNDNDSKISFEGTVNPLRLAVLKLGLTELKYTSPLNYEKREGIYRCANCGSTLFDSNGKYDSGSGWPSFWKTSGEDRIALKQEWDGRIECSCSNCGGHLGHVFPDGPMRKSVPQDELETIPGNDLKTSVATNEYTRLPRYCMNGAALKFQANE